MNEDELQIFFEATARRLEQEFRGRVEWLERENDRLRGAIRELRSALDAKSTPAVQSGRDAPVPEEVSV